MAFRPQAAYRSLAADSRIIDTAGVEAAIARGAIAGLYARIDPPEEVLVKLIQQR